MNSITIEKQKAKRPRKFAREPQHEPAGPNALATDSPASAQSQPKPKSKVRLLLDLLARPEGATLEQMVAATAWLPHTIRAALTGLKKKGHTVTSIKADGVRTYRVVTAKGEQISPPAGTEAQVDA